MSENNEKREIHAFISEEKYKIINKYVNRLDENGEKIFGDQSKVIEKALEALDKQFTPENSLQEIWNRARKELNMVLVGKTTYLSYITGGAPLAQEKNIAIEIIEWYKKKKIEDLSTFEILDAIKDIWMAANYFHRIEITEEDNGYQFALYHDFHDEQYSEFWGVYFMSLLKLQKKCSVEIFARNESLILTVIPPK